VETAGVRLASADREPIAVPPALTAAGRDALRAAGWDGATPLLLVHPGAGGPSKRWPADGFGRVLDAVRRRQGMAIVLHQGPADAEAVAALAGRLDGPAPVLREPPLPVLAGALVHAAAYLGNDSGVSHLAAAVGSPAVILFAPVNVRWRPWAPAARALVVAGPGVDGADVAATVTALDALLGRPAPALPRAADG
jgi:ADP-heptose:LPS heptosyltransferase